MAETAKQQKNLNDDLSESRSSALTQTLKDLGILFATGFVGGMAAAAGKHFYNATATKLGGQPASVTPLKRVV